MPPEHRVRQAHPGVDMRLRHSDFFDVDFGIEVRDARHLTHIAAALRACPSVETVDRAQG